MTDAFHTPESPSQYWRSLGELENSDEFVKHLEAEFPDEASVPVDGMSRRRFLSLMAASAALVGMSGCRWPREEIVPFGRRPDSYQPGKVKRFATTFTVGEAIKPVLVTSFDGRPIKVEGNPRDGIGAAGGTDAFSQAEIYSLYDPDRSKSPRRKVEGFWRGASWGEFEREINAELARTNGEGLAVLLPESMSVVEAYNISRLKIRYPQAAIYRHEALSRAPQRVGLQRIQTQESRPHAHLTENTRVVVDFESGLLTEHPDSLRLSEVFARARDPHRAYHGPPPRLYCFEASYSMTGAMADHRVPVASREIPGILALLAVRLLYQDRNPDPASPFQVALRKSLSRLPIDRIREQLAHLSEVIEALADDLMDNRDQAFLSLGPGQPEQAHALCYLIGGYLTGSIPQNLPPGPSYDRSEGTLPDLVESIGAGGVQTLCILGANPVYDASVDLDFAGALAQVGISVHLGLYEDETAAACTWHLPQAHVLESWDQLRKNYLEWYSVQPLIQPLYGGKTIAEFLSVLAYGEPISAYEMARANFYGGPFHGEGWGRVLDGPLSWNAPTLGPEFEAQWRAVLHEGVAHWPADEGDPTTALRRPVVDGRLAADLANITSAAQSPLGPDYLELNFAADSKVYDGRFANNGWLQELPDAITKLTWDNALLISPALAKEKGLKQGDMVELKYRERSLEVPVYVLPGQARYSMSLALGYGRTAAGNVGNNVGFNAYLLRTSDALWGGAGATITPTGRSYPLACTQDHHAIDHLGYDERERRAPILIREGTYAEYHEHPEFAEHMGPHHPPLRSLWEERGYDGLKWGMSIDLNACTGCNACVIACQAENNISVVGKDEVKRGREMQWLRIDRYFQGDPDSPTMSQQPMACVQCEMAPCEQVCPVAATMHNAEGLNVMVYNRCVGTRYCSNNCPYKVRRFNYFDNQKHLSEVEELGKNPEVTMRSRGVMEKCTYCVQRIEHARITAKNEERPIRDGEIVTACQQTCPTQAIVFGDLNDENSMVRKRVEDPRTYAVLAELNVKPRTTYMARLRNPNPRLVSATSHGEGHTAGTTGDEHAAGDAGETQTRGTQH